MKYTITCLVLLIAVQTSSEAAIITWGTAQIIKGDSDVSTNGTLFGALNLGVTGSNAATVVNGVSFAEASLPGSTVNPVFGNFAFTGSLFGSVTIPQLGLSPAYSALFASSFSENDSAVLTMSGLILGNQYEFQWWNRDTNPELPTTATAGTSVALNANIGQFAIGTFTADGVSQAITFSTGVGSFVSITALQLRDITPVTPAGVPEPATWLAMSGLGTLVLAKRRRSPLNR